jgi:hypothetical protein
MIAVVLLLLLLIRSYCIIFSLKRKLRSRFFLPEVERDGTGRRIHERVWR